MPRRSILNLGLCVLVVALGAVACGSSAESYVFDRGDLSEPVGCSLGFRIRNEASTVGLRVSVPVESDTSAPADGKTVFSIDDDEAGGSLLLGENVFYQLCDDVREPGEPEETIEATWKLVSGTLVLDEPIPDDPGGGGGVGTVRATATALVAQKPNGELVEMGDIELINNAWAFYGG